MENNEVVELDDNLVEMFEWVNAKLEDAYNEGYIDGLNGKVIEDE